MPITITTDEVHEFTHAVAGLEIDFVRTERGFGPAEMTSVDTPVAKISVGTMGFASIMQSEPPPGTVVVQLLPVAGGVTMCGVEMHPDRPSLFVPGTTVFGRLAAGVHATTLVASGQALQALAADLGTGDLDLGRTRPAMEPTPQVQQLVARLRDVSLHPDLAEQASNDTRLLESVVRALAATQPQHVRHLRRRDSGTIVALAREHADRSGSWLPTISELCRAALTSESGLRAAFVEVLGVPPSTYFQVRVLSELRRLLLVADPQIDTVSGLASSLGLTHFGRVAERYRALFGETPRQTLKHRSVGRESAPPFARAIGLAEHQPPDPVRLLAPLRQPTPQP